MEHTYLTIPDPTGHLPTIGFTDVFYQDEYFSYQSNCIIRTFAYDYDLPQRKPPNFPLVPTYHHHMNDKHFYGYVMFYPKHIDIHYFTGTCCCKLIEPVNPNINQQEKVRNIMNQYNTSNSNQFSSQDDRLQLDFDPKRRMIENLTSNHMPRQNNSHHFSSNMQQDEMSATPSTFHIIAKQNLYMNPENNPNITKESLGKKSTGNQETQKGNKSISANLPTQSTRTNIQNNKKLHRNSNVQELIAVIESKVKNNTLNIDNNLYNVADNDSILEDLKMSIRTIETKLTIVKNAIDKLQKVEDAESYKDIKEKILDECKYINQNTWLINDKILLHNQTEFGKKTEQVINNPIDKNKFTQSNTNLSTGQQNSISKNPKELNIAKERQEVDNTNLGLIQCDAYMESKTFKQLSNIQINSEIEQEENNNPVEEKVNEQPSYYTDNASKTEENNHIDEKRMKRLQANKKLKKLREEIKQLDLKVNEIHISRSNHDKKYIYEMLTRILSQLDNVDTGNDCNVQLKKRKCIAFATWTLERLRYMESKTFKQLSNIQINSEIEQEENNNPVEEKVNEQPSYYTDNASKTEENNHIDEKRMKRLQANKKLKNLREEIKQLDLKVNEIHISRSNHDKKYIYEMLTRILSQLDNVDTGNDCNVQLKKRKCIAFATWTLERLRY